jgi:transcriptional regulator with XRE-family HTH domain
MKARDRTVVAKKANVETPGDSGDHRDAFGFGRRLRAFRQERGLSIERAADVVGVPASTLSRIENRKMSPTLELIHKIVRGMGLHPYDVIGRDSGDDPGAISVTRAGKADYTELPNLLYTPLHANSTDSTIRPILISLFARSVEDYGGLTPHAGEEFLYVLRGSIELHFEGRPTQRLDVGDSILFDSHIPHAYVSVGAAQARILIVASTIDKQFGQLAV